MKKFLKTLVVIIFALLILLITIPYLFKDQILNKTREIINENVEARVSFDDVSVSLLKRFPDLNVGIHHLIVSGKGQFREDTLVQFKTLHAEVDLLSILKKQIVMEGVYLEEPRLKARIAPDSSVNWDIMKEAPEPAPSEQVDTAAEPSDYRVELKTFQITGGRLLFDDQPGDMSFSAHNLNFTMSGDLGADSSDLDMSLDVEPVNFRMGAVRYLNQTDVSFEAGIAANLKEERYHIRNNQLNVNGLVLNFDGLVSMAESGRIDTDIEFASGKTNFKSLLSLIPAFYMQDFKALETAGNLTLNGQISGYYHQDVFPSLDMNLQVEDAMFHYPDLPERASNIQISLQTYFDGKKPDKTKVNLERFHLEMAGSPFDASLLLRNPISNPTVNGALTGKVVLDQLAKVVPMEDLELRGVIDSDLEFAGSLDMVEQKRYNEFKANGSVNVTDLYVATPSLPEALTLNARMVFTPQYLDLKSLTGKLGKSDFSMTGKVSDYIGYVLEDGVLRGDFTLKSGYLNVNPFLAKGEGQTPDDTAAPQEMEVFKVPSRIDFKMDAGMDRIRYDRMQITNAGGTVLVRDQSVYLNDFAMNLFEGRLQADGAYNTPDTADASVNFDMALSDLQIQNALQSFRMMDTLAPILKRAEGKISMDLQYMSQLKTNMMPKMPTVNGFGELRSKQIRLSGSRSLGRILKALDLSESGEQTLNDLKINFLLRQGELVIKPFDVQLAGMGMTVSGSQRYDRTMDYDIQMRIPRSKLGGAANQVINNLVDKAASRGLDISPGENIPVGVDLTGTFSEPKVGLSFGRGEGEAGKDVKQQVREKVEETVQQQKQQAEKKAREEASEKARQIIDQAQKKADRIIRQARQAAEKLREEADKRANQVEKEAEGKNLLVRKAAEESAKKIRQQADKKARQLIDEAESKADSLVAEARKEARKIQQ